MKLNIVSVHKRVKNETTSWFQFQTTENEATSCFKIQTSLEMKLQVVSNFNLVNNKATSWFQAQTSQEWNYKLIPICLLYTSPSPRD